MGDNTAIEWSDEEEELRGIVQRITDLTYSASDVEDAAVGLARLLDERARAVEAQEAALDQIGKLTPREHEVVLMVSKCYTNKEAAQALGLSQRTVEVHRGTAYRKLGAKNAAAVAVLMCRAGLLGDCST